MAYTLAVFNVYIIAVHLGLVGAQRGRNILVAAALAVPAFVQYTLADRLDGYEYYAAAALSSAATCALVGALPKAKISNAVVWVSIALIFINGLGYALNFNGYPPLMYNAAVAFSNVLLTIILIPGGLNGLAGLSNRAALHWRGVKLRGARVLGCQPSTKEAD